MPTIRLSPCHRIPDSTVWSTLYFVDAAIELGFEGVGLRCNLTTPYSLKHLPLWQDIRIDCRYILCFFLLVIIRHFLLFGANKFPRAKLAIHKVRYSNGSRTHTMAVPPNLISTVMPAVHHLRLGNRQRPRVTCQMKCVSGDLCGLSHGAAQ